MEPPHSKTTLLFHVISTLKKIPKSSGGAETEHQDPSYSHSALQFNENITAFFHLLSRKTFRSILVTN